MEALGLAHGGFYAHLRKFTDRFWKSGW